LRFGLLFVLISISMTPLTLSAKSLSQEAQKFKRQYDALKLKQYDARLQIAYLEAFPSDARTFNRLFNHPRQEQLWDGNQYIFELESLAVKHPQKTFALVLKLAAQLTWQKDAPNYLQFVLMKIAIDNPFEFSKQFSALSDPERQSIVTYLTTSANGPAVGYRQLIEILKRINKGAIAAELAAGLK